MIDKCFYHLKILINKISQKKNEESILKLKEKQKLILKKKK